MPQLQLPIFPHGLTSITADLAFPQEDGTVVYFHGLLPVFQHDQKDLKSFRMYPSQWIANGVVRQRDMVRAFGVAWATVKRYMKVQRQLGTGGFFRPPRRRSANVLTPEVKQRAQVLLDEGQSVPEVSRELGVAGNTLHKAIQAGGCTGSKQKRLRQEDGSASNKSARSDLDSQAPRGYGATRSLERVTAAKWVHWKRRPWCSRPRGTFHKGACGGRCRRSWPWVCCATARNGTRCRKASTA